ncbi:MAG: hypothetical protein ACYTBJ_16550 [Planctomycetota bacterium]
MRREAIASVLILGAVAAVCAGEFAVNTRTTGDQKCAAPALDSSGPFLLRGL